MLPCRFSSFMYFKRYGSIYDLLLPLSSSIFEQGIFPREPRSRKKANKGSSAPASFYYAKDIAYLAHEPILKKLREHKAFAKKLARALGRGEWSSAKSLEQNKPIYRLDHIIKERWVVINNTNIIFLTNHIVTPPLLMLYEISTTPCA